jgi:DNA polymerase III epsilon subunit-like protein
MRQNSAIGKYLIVDCETSGLHPWENGLIQMAGLALDRELQVIDEYNVYINPPENVIFDAESDLIHGITKEKLEKEGLTYREFCLDFIGFVKRNFTKDRPVMVGQFFPFDYGFLETVFSQALGNDIALKDENQNQYGVFQNLLGRDFIDTKSMANILNLKAEIENKPPLFQNTSLSKINGLKDSLGIGQEKYKAHDALADCYATHEVLTKMVELFQIVN